MFLTDKHPETDNALAVQTQGKVVSNHIKPVEVELVEAEGEVELDIDNPDNDHNQEFNGLLAITKPHGIAWENLTFSVPGKAKRGLSTVEEDSTKKFILKNVSGNVDPGEVLAIMGPSGSGKTSLLDILANRVLFTSSKVLEGSIKIDRENRRTKSFQRIASYVAQEDTLLGSLTVRETMMSTAELSLPIDMNYKDKVARVENIISEMGLSSCKDTRIGDIFFKGISGGQKRRLSIGIALITNPSILLLDEATSGLDSAATHSIMKYIKKLAKNGRTVLLTIHQPSSDVYAHFFDKLMLLVNGKVAYFGNSNNAVVYFQSIGFSCPQYTNPAEYFLGLINNDFDGHADIDYIVKSFATYQTTNHHQPESNTSIAAVKEKEYDQRSNGHRFWNQFRVLMKRNMLNNIRNPGIYWVRLVMYIMLSLMIGTMYLRTNSDITSDQLVPMLFYVQAFMVFMSVAVLPFFIEQRGVFMRERADNIVDCAPYVVANFLAALPGVFLIAIICSAIIVPLAGLNGFGYFMLNLFLSLVCAESMMHVIGASLPQYILGIAIGAGIFGMFMLCEGFMVIKSAIPGWWIWCYYIAFHTWSFQWFMYNEYNESGTSILAMFDIPLDLEIWKNIVILIFYSIFLQLCLFGILYKFHTGKR